MTERDISSKGLTVAAHYESLRLHPYNDGTGVWTIGRGHSFTKEQLPRFEKGISMAEADSLFHRDMQKAVSAVNDHIHVTTNQDQFDALVSLVFNTGPAPLTHTLGSVLNSGDYFGAAQQFQMWCTATLEHKGRGPIAGLFYRRLTETYLFLKGEIFFVHTWAAAQPLISKIRTIIISQNKMCIVPHYKPADFIG